MKAKASEKLGLKKLDLEKNKGGEVRGKFTCYNYYKLGYLSREYPEPKTTNTRARLAKIYVIKLKENEETSKLPAENEKP